MTPELPYVYLNGAFIQADAPAVSALDRGLTLADGLFETMIARPRGIFRLSDHLARMHDAATLLELRLPVQQELQRILESTWKNSSAAAAVLRMTVTRGTDPGRGVAVRPNIRPNILVRVMPMPTEPPELGPSLRVHTNSFPRNEQSPLSRVKSLAYTEPIVAWLEAHRANADDALWRNTRGNYACATASNLFIVTGNRLVTPPMSEGALPGIARMSLLSLAPSLGMQAVEAAVTPADLANADEVFLTNVVRGPIPVAEVDGKPVKKSAPGPYTKQLAAAYWRLVES